MSAALIWLIARYVPGAIVTHSTLTGAVIVFAVLGLVIEGLSVLSFIRAKTTVNPLRPQRANRLVVSGMNGLSRNPMYLGMLLLLTAWALYCGHVGGLVPLIIFVVYITQFQIKPEEVALEEKFGPDYLAYKAKVRRWI